MQLTIRYCYEDRRKTATRPVGGHVLIEVPSVSDLEAPVVLCARRNFGKPRHPGTPQSVALRIHLGRIWTPGPVFDGIPMPAADEQTPWRYLIPSGFTSTGVLGSRVELPAGDSLHIATDREAIERAIQEWADNCLLVDGQLHRPTLLPQYIVRIYADRAEVNLTCLGMTLDPSEEIFPATALDDARAHAQSLYAKDRHELPPELMPAYVLEVRRPDLLPPSTR
jgi:hypothetical protein